MLVPRSDHLLVEYLEALHLVLVGVFGNILDNEFENGVRILKEEVVEALRTHNLRMTTKVRVLVQQAPKYVKLSLLAQIKAHISDLTIFSMLAAGGSASLLMLL